MFYLFAKYPLPTIPCLRALMYLVLVFMCTQCGPSVSEKQLQAAAQLPVDTVEVASFNIERENSRALANWAVFEAGREVICVPPGWTSHLENVGQELVLLPPNSADSTERVTFTRLAKDSPTLDYPALAHRLVTSAFPGFRLAAGDTVKKLVFQHDFAIERNVGLRAKGRSYEGYCLVYVNDSSVYQFRVILENNRLKAYKGDLLSDIIGNLQINKNYFFGKGNPLKQLIYLH